MRIKKAVVILPCLNEEKTVNIVIKKLREVEKKSKIKFIIIAINDASTDSTKNKINNADIKIHLEKKVCLSEIMRIGLKKTKEIKPDIVIHIDADLQHNPDDVIKLLKKIDEKTGIVIGTRFNNSNHFKIEKTISNHFFTSIINIITGLNLNDTQSGFRILNYDFIKKINLISSYTYTHEEIMLAKKLGYKIKEVPIKVNKRKYGNSRLNYIKYLIISLYDIIRISVKN
jgi:hypothetical protein